MRFFKYLRAYWIFRDLLALISTDDLDPMLQGIIQLLNLLGLDEKTVEEFLIEPLNDLLNGDNANVPDKADYMDDIVVKTSVDNLLYTVSVFISPLDMPHATFH